MTVVSTSDKEFSRLDVLLDLEAGRSTIRDAGELMGLRRRQVFRLVKAFRQRGAASLVSCRRGRPSNNRLPAGLEPGVRRAVDLNEFADALTSVARLVHRGQTSAPVKPEAIRHHPLTQGLAGHPAPMNLSKLLSRQGRTEIGIALRDVRHGETAHGRRQTVVAGATTPA